MTDSCTCCKMAKFPAWQTVKCKWTWNDKIHLYISYFLYEQTNALGGRWKLENWKDMKISRFLEMIEKRTFQSIFLNGDNGGKWSQNVWKLYDGSLRLSSTTRLNGCLIASFPVSGVSTKCGGQRWDPWSSQHLDLDEGEKKLKWSLTVHETHPQHDSSNLLRLEI